MGCAATGNRGDRLDEFFLEAFGFKKKEQKGLDIDNKDETKTIVEVGSSDIIFSEEIMAHGDESGVIKPWLEGMLAPEFPLEEDLTPPKYSLKIEHVFGFRTEDSRKNLYFLSNYQILYSTSSLGIIQNLDDNTQTLFGGFPLGENKETLTKLNSSKEFIPNIYKSKMTFQIDNKDYKLQMAILKELKKLKLSLEVNEKEQKVIYSNSFTLNELISLNKFFSKFKDSLEAFSYLLHNYTKIEKTVKNPNNQEIKILLTFSIHENEGEKSNNNKSKIKEETIEFFLFSLNSLYKSKSFLTFTSTIQNLKTTLEKFNSSINEIKYNFDNDKLDKDNIKNELKNIINCKFGEINKNKIIKELVSKIKKIEEKNNKVQEEQKPLKEKIESICTSMKEYSKEINAIKKKIEENETKYNENLELIKNRNNNISKDKINENEVSIYSNKFDEFLNKINNLEENIKINKEKAQEIETNINNKLTEFNEKVNMNFQRLSTSQSNSASKDSVNIKNEENMKLDNLIQDKINEQINSKLKFYEEKIQMMSKKISDLEYKNQNKSGKSSKNRNDDSSFMKDNSFIDFKFNELENNKVKEFNINENSGKKNNSSENENKQENKIKEIEINKIQDLKKEICSMLNKMNEKEKEDYKDINNKIIEMREDLIKIMENKNISLENKVKSCLDKINFIEKGNKSLNDLSKSADKRFREIDTKIKSTENRIKIIDNKIGTIKTFDLNSNTGINNFLANNQRLPNYSDEESYKTPKPLNSTFSIFRDGLQKVRRKVIDTYIDSKIFKREEVTDDNFLFWKIKEIYPYNRHIKLVLVYRASRDGGSARFFHIKCDFIGPNLTIIKTKKGFVFGGFTLKNWKHQFKDVIRNEPQHGTEHIDEKAFTFCMNNRKIYTNGKINDNVIYCNNNCCTCFKNFFKVYDEVFKNGGICGKINESNFNGQERDYEFNGGEQKFEIEEMEVFLIAFR